MIHHFINSASNLQACTLPDWQKRKGRSTWCSDEESVPLVERFFLGVRDDPRDDVRNALRDA